MKLWTGAAAALLLLGSSPAVAQPAQEPEISAEDIAAASAIPDAFLVRLRSGNGAAAIGQAFAGTMMEYQNAQLQALITYLNTLTDYYGPVTGWELGRQETFTSRLVRQTYLVFTDNGPYVATFDLYRRSTGWILLRINLHDRSHDLFHQTTPSAPSPAPDPAPAS